MNGLANTKWITSLYVHVSEQTVYNQVLCMSLQPDRLQPNLVRVLTARPATTKPCACPYSQTVYNQALCMSLQGFAPSSSSSILTDSRLRSLSSLWLAREMQPLRAREEVTRQVADEKERERRMVKEKVIVLMDTPDL